MDYLLLRRCSGNTYCHYSHRIQNGFVRLLKSHGLTNAGPQPTSFPTARLSYSARIRPFTRSLHIPSLTPIATFTTKPNSKEVSGENEADAWLERYLGRLGGEVERALSSRAENLDRLLPLTSHYFGKGGKLIRPRVILLYAAALAPPKAPLSVSHRAQEKIAVVAEMIHTASLVHDDIIDESPTRRGQPSVHAKFGNKAAVLAGDYILASATRLLCSIDNPEIISILSQVIEDLVKGEFMQMGDRDGFDSRFNHYMEKTFKKTASLFAHSCQAVAALSPDTHPDTLRVAFEFGKQFGLAFQLVDDILDCSATEEALGKPTGADLHLGLSTAPLLFASRRQPKLEPLIRRRFSEEGDVEAALEMIKDGHGILEAQRLAESHAKEAARLASSLKTSPFSAALHDIALAQTARSR